jgi:maleate isomerase
MHDEIAIGTITPSGNRTVERLTQSICGMLDGVVPLFTRIPVYGSTSPENGGAGPYDWPTMMRAAELLGHAAPKAICWNGSKGGEYGFDVDERLCADMEAKTGIPAVTSALSVVKLLRRLDVRRIAMVTPYTGAGQARCIAGFEAKGFEIAGERHGGLTDNLSYGSVTPQEIAGMARAAVSGGSAQAIVFFCTNFNGAPAAEILEAETGLPVIDSTAAGVHAVLRAAGVETSAVKGYGGIFAL